MKDDLIDEVVSYTVKVSNKLNQVGYNTNYSIQVVAAMLCMFFWAVRNETHADFKKIVDKLMG